ncbi:MFS transporter [Nostoc sp. CHAB 5784]|nr:MFS transporter [Nostoc mirabile CHAB5784]
MRTKKVHNVNSQRWTTLTVCLVGAFMTLLDISILNVALPSIQKSLYVSESGLQWIVCGYTLIYGLVLVPAGRLGDTRGRKMVFTIGLAIFILASVLTAVSIGEVWIIIARLGQGVGAGVLMPQITGLIQQIFPPLERGKAFGLFGAVIGVSTSVGPLIGGMIIQIVGTSDGWRWIFGVNVLIGIVVLPLSYRLIPELAEHRFVDGEGAERNDLDLLGIVLLGLAMVLLLLPVIQIQQWHGNSKWLLVVIGVVLFALFMIWEQHCSKTQHIPLVNVGLFRTRSFSVGIFIGMLFFAGSSSLPFTLSLYLQNGIGYTAIMTGLVITPFAIGSAASSAASGRYMLQFGHFIVTGALVLVGVGFIGIMAVHHIPGNTSRWNMVLPLFIAGLGSGTLISGIQTLTLRKVPRNDAGSASAVLQASLRISTTIGNAIVGSVFYSKVNSSHGNWADAFQTGLMIGLTFVAAALVVAVRYLFQVERA